LVKFEDPAERRIAVESKKMPVCLKAVFLFFLIVAGPGVVNSVFAQGAAGTRPDNAPVLQIKQMGTDKSLYSIELRDVLLSDLFRVIARDYNLNILVDQNVAGTVTASFTNISLDEALEAVADLSNLSIVKKGKIVKVSTNFITKTFVLKYIEAGKLLETAGPSQVGASGPLQAQAAAGLSGLLSNKGKILLGRQQNSLTVIDYPDNIKKFEEYIKVIDHRMESRVYKLKYLKAEEVVGAAGKTAQAVVPAGTQANPAAGRADAGQVSSDIRSLLSGEGKIIYGDEPNSIVAMDYPDNLDRIGQYFEIMDTSPQQVLIEARVIEVVLKDEHSLGINWNLLSEQGGLKLGGYRLTSSGSSSIDQSIPFIPVYQTPGTATSTTSLDPFTLAVSSNDINAVLKAMASTLDTNVLSAPRVATVNNRPADISIVQRYPWAEPQLTISDSGSTTITWAVNWEEIGIALHVTPVINPDGNISMTLHPDISELVDKKSMEVKDGSSTLTYDIPVIDKRTTSTKVVVKSGQTLIFGGLIKDRQEKSSYKVPLMGDLPFLGHLFKSSHTYKEKTELLILVSPTIIDSAETARMAKQIRYGPGQQYTKEEERQNRMMMILENRENEEQDRLSAQWEGMLKKQQQLAEQTSRLEQAVLSEENNLKNLEYAKKAVIARERTLTEK